MAKYVKPTHPSKKAIAEIKAKAKELEDLLRKHHCNLAIDRGIERDTLISIVKENVEILSYEYDNIVTDDGTNIVAAGKYANADDITDIPLFDSEERITTFDSSFDDLAVAKAK